MTSFDLTENNSLHRAIALVELSHSTDVEVIKQLEDTVLVGNPGACPIHHFLHRFSSRCDFHYVSLHRSHELVKRWANSDCADNNYSILLHQALDHLKLAFTIHAGPTALFALYLWTRYFASRLHTVVFLVEKIRKTPKSKFLLKAFSTGGESVGGGGIATEEGAQMFLECASGILRLTITNCEENGENQCLDLAVWTASYRALLDKLHRKVSWMPQRNSDPDDFITNHSLLKDVAKAFGSRVEDMEPGRQYFSW